MSSITTQDRADLCTFTFADGRQCRSPRASKGTPRSDSHLYLCTFHARKEVQAQAADKLGRDVSYFFSGEYLSACLPCLPLASKGASKGDPSNALGRLFPAVVRGDVKPKTAGTLAYLAQTLLQTIQFAQNEFTNSCGNQYWKETVRESLEMNHEYRKKPAPPHPQQTEPSVSDSPARQATENDEAAESPLRPLNTHEPSPD
jgi:hypothetical protein